MEDIRTADGVPFRLGMTLYTETGREIRTSEDQHEVESFDATIDGIVSRHHVLGRKGGSCQIGISTLYSGRAAILRDRLDGLRDERAEIDHAIAEAEAQLAAMEAEP